MGKIRMTLKTGNKQAFSLVEMLIVLAIMAMIMGISLPFTSGFGKSLKIKTTARAIVGMIRVARSNAVTLRENYSVVFDVKKSQYWIENNASAVYEKKYPLPGSIKFEIKDDENSDPVTFEGDRVTFNASGLVEGSGGAVTITDRQGSSRTISVSGAIEKVTAN
jgi:prepilin-type N-terminal cleavage/methylation domain-containing protein